MTEKQRQMIVKAVLLLRRCGNKTATKERQIAEQMEWAETIPGHLDAVPEWIESLEAELRKTPEQKEEEARIWQEDLEKWEAEQARQENEYLRHDRDEWDDLWADRAREVGAIPYPF